MPTVKQKPGSDSNVALMLLPPTPPPSSSHHQVFAPYATVIYFALAAFGVISLLRFVLRRLASILPAWTHGLRRLRTRQQHYEVDLKPFPIVSSATTVVGNTHMPETSPNYDAAFEEEAQNLWVAELSPSPVRIGGLTATSVSDMEEQHSTVSRGVSRTSTGSKGWFSSSHPDTVLREEHDSRWPRSLKHSGSTGSSGHSTPSDLSNRVERYGKHRVDDPNWGDSLTQGAGHEDQVDGRDGNAPSDYNHGEDGDRVVSIATAMFSRPPQPPPLTPPELSPTVFTLNTLQDRHSHYAISVPAESYGEFIHQPNPDYMASTTSAGFGSVDDSIPKSVMSTVIPQRWSYTKTVPIGIPMPSRSNSFPHQTDRINQGVPSSRPFSPSSYPPSSPRLPPAPPEAYEQAVYDQAGVREGQMQLQGEIISAVDDAGHGWKRHTRVYGGGVCLACAASGKTHGSGGFYGPKVPLSERR